MFISSVILDNSTDKVSDIEGRIDLYQDQIFKLHKKKIKDLIYQNEFLKQRSKLASRLRVVRTR